LPDITRILRRCSSQGRPRRLRTYIQLCLGAQIGNQWGPRKRWALHARVTSDSASITLAPDRVAVRDRGWLLCDGCPKSSGFAACRASEGQGRRSTVVMFHVVKAAYTDPRTGTCLNAGVTVQVCTCPVSTCSSAYSVSPTHPPFHLLAQPRTSLHHATHCSSRVTPAHVWSRRG
jgi:hypothetical protein